MIVGQISIPVLGRLARGEAIFTEEADGSDEEVFLNEAEARQRLAELVLAGL